MEIHYVNNAQISVRADDLYKFELPKFGESTTDPTYYEPTATRIANMRRSAGSFVGLYDFDGPVSDSVTGLKQLDNAQVDVRYAKHGMTKEEISQTAMLKSLQADELIKNKKQSAKDNAETLKKEVAMAEAVASKISANSSAESSGEE